LDPSASGFAGLNGVGSVSVASGGVLSTSAAAGSSPAYVRVPVTNASGGVVLIGAPDTRQDNGSLTTNSGAFTVSGGGALSLTGGSSFTNAAGTLTLTGVLSEGSGTFTESGGVESGNPVVLSGATLADSAGTGAFDIRGSSTLTGDVPVGQTVTVDGAATSVFAAIPGATTVHGRLALDPSASGFAGLNGVGSVSVASGGVLSTSAAAGSSPAYVRVPVTNASGGVVLIGAPDTRQDVGTSTTNSGTFSVSDGGHLSLSGGSTLTNASAGTLGVTVNATTSSASGISGPGVSLAGTLGVQTIGSPALGSTFVPITGPVSGTFAAFAFGPHAYTVSYPSGAVQLTTAALFTISPTSFSPSKNIPTGPVQVATIGNATNGTGTYSATVDWGDASSASTATVAITGNTGTVTAPSHTYTSAGSFVVTTSVQNTNGTMLMTTTTVNVPGLAVTAVSPTSGSAAGGTTVTITGTGFTGATAVTFGGTPATGVTVVSDSQISAVSPAHATGTVDIQVTTPGGTSAAVAADQYTYTTSTPIVTAVSPTSGATAGGTTVTITGTGFTGATGVLFGSKPATGVTVVSDTQISAVSPAHVGEVVHVRVVTPLGTSPSGPADRYTYVVRVPAITAVAPMSGTTAGGTSVTITGTGFTGATAVLFGFKPATGVTVVSDTQITAVSPAHPAEGVNVRVTAPGGTSPIVLADRYSYI
jgi:hypothetical protein